jgi:hypothetical protein
MKYTSFLYVFASTVIVADPIGGQVYADSKTRFAAAITEVNRSPTTYGLGAGTVLPALPTIPTGKDGLYYEPATGNTFELVRSSNSNGWDAPNTAGDALTTALNITALIAARVALDLAAHASGGFVSTGPI